MIHDIDESLREWAKRDVLNGANVEISFEAPTKEWSARRNAPAINLYLYDIREDLDRRQVQAEEVRDEKGLVVARRIPPRRFKLSYLVTAWTQRPEDEHRLLSAALSCFLASDAVPSEILQGEVAEQPYPLRVTVGLPLPADRAISDVWQALGGELKPSLDVIITAPFETGRRRPFGPPVTEPPRVTLSGGGATDTKVAKAIDVEGNGAAKPAEPSESSKAPAGKKPAGAAKAGKQQAR